MGRHSWQQGPDSIKAALPNTSSADSIKFELLLGLLFAQTAIRSSDPEETSRISLKARMAYDTALRQLPEAELSVTDSPEIETGFWELRAKLATINEFV